MGERADPVADPGSVLLLAPPMDPLATEVCLDLLSGPDGGVEAVVNVLFTRRPDRRVENWRRHVGELPETFEILSTQSPASTPGSVPAHTLGSPGDLTGIGVAVTEHLGRWPDGVRGTCCLHSLTAQLQYAGAEAVYRFLSALLDHLSAAGVRGHVHLNPRAHDGRTIETFEPLFDAVVEVDGDDGRVSTR